LIWQVKGINIDFGSNKRNYMPFVRIWIHLIWSTKNHAKIISPSFRTNLLNHILENAKKKQIYIDTINCVDDHCHALISLGASQTISKIALLIICESSFWINQNRFCPGKFEWQEEYFAISASESQLNKVREYINSQEEHHRKITFQEEFKLFMEKHGAKFLG
jgi:putative transposase